MKVIKVRSSADLQQMKKVYLNRYPSLVIVDRVDPVGFDGYRGGKLVVRVVIPDSQ